MKQQVFATEEQHNVVFHLSQPLGEQSRHFLYAYTCTVHVLSSLLRYSDDSTLKKMSK